MNTSTISWAHACQSCLLNEVLWLERWRKMGFKILWHITTRHGEEQSCCHKGVTYVVHSWAGQVIVQVLQRSLSSHNGLDEESEPANNHISISYQ